MRVRIALLGLLPLCIAGPALAQPEVTDYDPAKPIGSPRSTVVQQSPTPPPTIITIGPDGKPVAPAASAPGGVTHYDGIYSSLTPDDEDTVEVHSGVTPELHVVRRGDTLWDICWYYFNDPWQWPKVWSYNGQITNPHWIYPGDLVRLLPKGFLSVVTDDPGLEPETDPGAAPAIDAPTPVRRQDVSVRQVAFIDKKHLDSAMFIVGSVDDKELLSAGDEVYVSYPEDKIPKVGERHSIYAEDQKIEHKDKVIGSYVRIVGELQITSVKQDKRAQGRIVSSNTEVTRGQRVGPLLRQFKTVPPTRNEVDAQGTIVAMLTSDQLIGQGEVVFMDLGKGSGIKVGNRLFVVRRGDAFVADADPGGVVGQDDRAFPARALGQVVVVQVGDTLSVGLVDRSVEEMGVGDLVMMRKQ
jgi:hypothetical protein